MKPTKQSWLNKASEDKKKWQKRFVTLEGHQLTYVEKEVRSPCQHKEWLFLHPKKTRNEKKIFFLNFFSFVFVRASLLRVLLICTV